MDVTNNEENGSNVVANEPQKNEEEVAEKVKTSDVNGNPEVEIKIEEASSAEEMANKPPHDTREEEPVEQASSEGKATQETNDSKVEENDKNSREEIKEQVNNESSSKNEESTKDSKGAEVETPVVVESAKGELDSDKSGTNQNTVVEGTDHDQTKSTENGTEGGTTSTNGGDVNANVLIDGTKGERTEQEGHIDNGKQNEDDKVVGIDQDQSNSKTDENISMNEDKSESNAGKEASSVKTDNYDVTNKHDTSEDFTEMKEPVVGGKIDLESSKVPAEQEPSVEKTAEKVDGNLTKTDESEPLESEKHENVSEVSRDSKETRGSQEIDENKEETQDSMNCEVESSRQGDAESSMKKSLEEEQKFNGEAKDVERGSEEQYETSEHIPEGQRSEGDKELHMDADRGQERNNIVEKVGGGFDSATVSQRNEKSSRRERSSTASSDKSTRRSRRRSSKGSLEERRLRDLSSERRGKHRNEQNAHFQDYLTRQVKEGKESEQYLKQKLEQKDHELEAAERKVKDLQLRLKRFVKDDKAKDERILLMEKELKDLNEKLNILSEMVDLNSNTATRVQDVRNEGAYTQGNSRLCLIL